MDLLPSPEQTEIIESSASFLAAQMPLGRTRSLFETGVVPAVDAGAWAAAAELGWFALGLPADLGGVGCGLADEVLLLREIGRVLAPGPFVSTVLGARVAAFGGAPGLADEIIAGRRVGLAVPGTAHPLGADGSLGGAVQLIDGTDGLVLVVTPVAAAIIDVSDLTGVETVPCIDPTVLLQRATATAVRPVATLANTADPIQQRADVLVAAVLTGIAEWACAASARHAIDRVQFGRPIGVNQAVKHPCADSLVQSRLAYAQTLFAGLAVDEGRADAELQAVSALLTASAAADSATAVTVQVLGGMGFTHEHDVQLYVKKTIQLTQTLGGTSARLSRLLTLPEPN
jgi:alkylation response protein AidB-like acyl-CoA dehydrogenase